MGAKTGLLVYSDGDAPGLLRQVDAADLDRTTAMMRRLCPGWEIEECGGSDLWDGVYPPKGTAYAAGWPGVDVIGDQRVMIDAPSQLPGHLVAASAGRRLVLHAMHSVVDWLAFVVWEDGRLVRSLSLSPDSGIIENIGESLPFELPSWAGDRPADIVPWPGRRKSRTPCPSTPWTWVRTPCVRSAASSRKAVRSPMTSTRRPSHCTDSTCGSHMGLILPSRKPRYGGRLKRCRRRAFTRWGLMAR